MNVLLTALLLAFMLTACSEDVPFASLPKTDRQSAWSYAERSVSFGVRHSGSRANADSADWILKTASGFRKFKVSEQRFEEQTPGGKITFRNLIAELPGRSREWVLIAAHYDAKKLSSSPGFQAANDGASGVAALLAMIQTLEKYPGKPPFTLRFVFFDGEECLYRYTGSDGLHGSRALAEAYERSGELKHCRAMILLDMIGDRDLNLTLPANTSPALMKHFERIVRTSLPDLRYEKLSYDMLDDHVPFFRRGVPCIDLIDFDYGPKNSYWHSDGDTLDNISAESICTVADLALALAWDPPDRS
ncbi:MAG: Zn-dependent exopeptidase M28 [Lentisphaeria bacterium]|nr:Zn-dependent exopeptidase M28 [Lentisphaeria bacterium]